MSPQSDDLEVRLRAVATAAVLESRAKPVEPLVLRPTWSTLEFKPVRGALALFAVGVAFAYIFRNDLQSLAITSLLVLVVFGLSALALARTRITVTQDGLSSRGMFRSREHPIPAGVVKASVRGRALQPPPRQDSFLLGDDGSFLLRMRGNTWSEAQIDLLAKCLGIAPVTFDEAVEPKALIQTWPGSAPYWETHPSRFALLFIPVVAVASVTVVLLRWMLETSS